MVNDIHYRRITPEQVDSYLHLRLRAVAEEAHAFVDTPDETQEMPKEVHTRRLADHYMLGAFDREALVGMAGYYTVSQKKYQHRGYVHSVYLLPEYRGKKIAATMLKALIDHARQHVEHLELSVNAESVNAKALYERVGFKSYGTFPKLMKLPDGSYTSGI